jgi:hypothetical protein
MPHLLTLPLRGSRAGFYKRERERERVTSLLRGAAPALPAAPVVRIGPALTPKPSQRPLVNRHFRAEGGFSDPEKQFIPAFSDFGKEVREMSPCYTMTGSAGSVRAGRSLTGISAIILAVCLAGPLPHDLMAQDNGDCWNSIMPNPTVVSDLNCSVGIGTTSPTEYGHATTLVGISSSGNTELSLESTAPGASNWVFVNQGGLFYLVNQTTGAIPYFATPSGNMGIGTTDAQNPLSVNGTIQAKEVLVNTGWSDYVFDKDYPLVSLEQTAKYVEANHNLPGIPSAKEVEEKGVNLGDMQARLLAKIEELTLHMIEANKRIDDLERRNRRLEEKAEGQDQ